MAKLPEGPSEFAGMCRGCLMPSQESRCLLDDDRDTTELLTKFQAVSQLQIIINDQFPSYLCKECEDKTNEAYQFQKICKNSDAFVKAILGIKETEEQDSENETKNNTDFKSTDTTVIKSEVGGKPKNIKKEKNLCKICNKLLRSEEMLKNHIRMHEQEKKKSKGSPSKRSPRKLKNPKTEPEDDSSDETQEEYIHIKRESSDDIKSENDDGDNDNFSETFDESPKKNRGSPRRKQARKNCNASDDNDENDDEEYVPEKPKKTKTSPRRKQVRKSVEESVDSDDDEYSDDAQSPKKIKTSPQRNSSRKQVSGIKLKQFAKENVESVIETIKKRMEESKSCRFCEFTSVNPRSMCFHMSMVHKEHRASWCWICNENFDNVEEHSKVHVKDLECPFCQRVSKNNTSLIYHLSRHAATTSIRCKPCDVSFERQELLNRHNEEMHPKTLDPGTRLVKQMRLEKRLEAGLKQRSRVAQFPKEQVDAQIRQIEEKMNAPADCPLCEFSAANRSTLGTHMAGTHKKHKDKWCYYCNQTGIDDLKAHKESVHAKEYVCPFCSKNISCGVTRLIEHLLRHSESKSFKCLHCDKCFINEKYMLKHQKLHDEVQSLAVAHQDGDDSSDDDKKLSEYSQRGYVIQEAADVKEEVEIKEGDVRKSSSANRFCTVCQKTVSCLDTHMKMYHSEVPESSHLCSECGKTFASKSNLNAHMKLHSEVRPHKCTHCGKSFHIFSSLRIHMRKHTKEKPYICNVCGKCFSRSGQLTTHMRIHTGKPFPCTSCEKRFCRPSELRIHMRKHTGETPYVCDVCGRGFTHTSNMYNHRRTHFGERPYQCRYCDKTFSQSDCRKAHEFIHTGIKPFKCSICTFSCIKSYDLTKHMMSHDSDRPMLDKPYSCEVCTKRFQTKAHLFSHFDMYHQSSQYHQMQEQNDSRDC